MLDAALITCIDNTFYITSTESCLNIQTALYMLYFKTTACFVKGLYIVWKWWCLFMVCFIRVSCDMQMLLKAASDMF